MTKTKSEKKSVASQTARTMHGSCHCGAVRYEVDGPFERVSQCNCTMCRKVNMINTIVKPPAFRLTQGKEKLSTFSRYPGAFRHFCSVCGVGVYGTGDIPEMGGAFVAVIANTLDDLDTAALPMLYWDGRHDSWMNGPAETPHLLGEADLQVRA